MCQLNPYKPCKEEIVNKALIIASLIELREMLSKQYTQFNQAAYHIKKKKRAIQDQIDELMQEPAVKEELQIINQGKEQYPEGNAEQLAQHGQLHG
jgi:phage pi2 protein 07